MSRLVFVVSLLLFVGTGQTMRAADPVRFTEILIADKYGYTFGSAAGDLDGDGDLDLTNVDIVGKKPSAASLLWFQNDGRGNLQRHVIHDGEDGWLERHAIGDLSGDKLPDVAVVSNRDGLLLWFEHPGRNLTGKWRRRVISSECSHAYDVVMADLDGDGDLDAATAGYTSHAANWYENPGREGWDGNWPRHVLAEDLRENRTIRVGDFSGDGKPDLLVASVGVSYTAVGPEGKPEEHGAVTAWLENPGDPKQPWPRHVIDETSRGAIHGQPVDLDRDGDLDVVMAFGMRAEHIPEAQHQIVWYENLGSPGEARKWKRHVIAAFPCAFEAIAVDLDGDGDLDVAGTSWSKGDRVAWFENSGDPRQSWKLHVLKENFFAANQIIAADLNGDGRPDLIATADDGSGRVQGANEIRWWRNDGRK